MMNEEKSSPGTKGLQLNCKAFDFYQYSFSPLLLFTTDGYFDKGYSNYNSVAEFFQKILNVDMFTNVLFESKNMYYDLLVNEVTTQKYIVVCCIQAHFTGFQILSKESIIYYDPMNSGLSLIYGEESCNTFLIFHLLKCQYGDSQHIAEHQEYYTGDGSTSLRKMIYKQWETINDQSYDRLYKVKSTDLQIMLEKYMLFNNSRDPSKMSTQATGNTCYFQTYLFALFMRITDPSVIDRQKLIVKNVEKLQEMSILLARYLNEFFYDSQLTLRPYTNNNVIMDFNKYTKSSYFNIMQKYLEMNGISIKYELQYEALMTHFTNQKILQIFAQYKIDGNMASTQNTKELQLVCDTDDSRFKLAGYNYYQYRAVNMMFGFHANIMRKCFGFYQFNSLRKNFILSIRPLIERLFNNIKETNKSVTQFRDYYFMALFEVGQQELIDAHQYTYLIDMNSLMKEVPQSLKEEIANLNSSLIDHLMFSTQKYNNYQKQMDLQDFRNTKDYVRPFLEHFMTQPYFQNFVSLGFNQFNSRQKEQNALTHSVFYTTELMRQLMFQQEYEFERECICQMAQSSMSKYTRTLEGTPSAEQAYSLQIKIGYGYTYSGHNTILHFLSIIDNYWNNPDINAIQIFGQDIRTLLVFCCQKIIFSKNHDYFNYGHLSDSSAYYSASHDLLVATDNDEVIPLVYKDKKTNLNQIPITERVYAYDFLRSAILSVIKTQKSQIQSDDAIINLCLLSLLLDFKLYNEYYELLNIQFLNDDEEQDNQQEKERGLKKGLNEQKIQMMNHRQLQVTIANQIHDFDQQNQDSIQIIHIQQLIYECSYQFIVSQNFDVRSKQYQCINTMNCDHPTYSQHLLLVQIYMSLCQINQSVELDYYQIRCDNQFRILIPDTFSKSTSEYLEKVTSSYYFFQKNNWIGFDNQRIFSTEIIQPEIELYKIRVQSEIKKESMYRYIEISNAFLTQENDILIFVAGNIMKFTSKDSLELKKESSSKMSKNMMSLEPQTKKKSNSSTTPELQPLNILLNRVPVEFVTIYVNRTISFIPCFQYTDSEDVIILTSPQFYFHVDTAGQFNEHYYGMKFQLIENILVLQSYIDATDQHVFQNFQLSSLVVETQTVLYSPRFMFQFQGKSQIISLIDYALQLRHISLFGYLLMMLIRVSIDIDFDQKGPDRKTKQITGPWFNIILYVINSKQLPDSNYDSILKEEFLDLDQYNDLPISKFIDRLSEHFTDYQKRVNGEPQIIPTQKQRDFVQQIITGEESFYFSEVGSGQTKVIVPLLCQMFLSNNQETHINLAKRSGSGKSFKSCLFIIVPEHLVLDAQAQAFRYCLNLNFQQDYKIYDDVFNLLHSEVEIGKKNKLIFISSFNEFKKALTFDSICNKLQGSQDEILMLIDEVDDFLDREKLIFNICQNQNNDFQRSIIESYYLISSNVYKKKEIVLQDNLFTSSLPSPGMLNKNSKLLNDVPEKLSNPAFGQFPLNPEYWDQLYFQFSQIHQEIQQKSKSINKSFGIFNEQTLKHSSSNIAQDIEGYKSLIARPYESVNRAMPGSYYSDVERTIYLTYYILMEDISKYNNLFQQQRKFITFDYYNTYIKHLDFDELIYGNTKLSQLVEIHPDVREGLIKYLYEIILRKMEIQDRSRSVNSIDVILNFDCKGFTGTPFIDNYPTYSYIQKERKESIPGLINREFYLHSNNPELHSLYQNRLKTFQGDNHTVLLKYVESQFMQNMESESEILERIFQEQSNDVNFNCIVDLCGIFQRISIQGVQQALNSNKQMSQRFQYIYHIDQINCSDRILYLHNETDVQYDEEFYRRHCDIYGDQFAQKIFFFIDNRNVIGKDIPFQFLYLKMFKVPLIYRSLVIAHDVEDFSKIWQAMGRSRTMNVTEFVIYKSNLSELIKQSQEWGRSSSNSKSSSTSQSMQLEGNIKESSSHLINIQDCEITKYLYVKNCDKKVTGNLSSIYQTLISLYNLYKKKFYYDNELINIFLLKMEKKITPMMERHFEKIDKAINRNQFFINILRQIFLDKFQISDEMNSISNSLNQNDEIIQTLFQLNKSIIWQQFQQRVHTNDIMDTVMEFLSGEQKNLNQYSYTKQQQQQKQTQANRNQDSDTMQTFDQSQQISLKYETKEYFQDSKLKNQKTGELNQFIVQRALNCPVLIKEICAISYQHQNQQRIIQIYPTLQFLYSTGINPDYITDEIQQYVLNYTNGQIDIEQDLTAAQAKTANNIKPSKSKESWRQSQDSDDQQIEQQKDNQKANQNLEFQQYFDVKLLFTYIRQNPKFTLLYMGKDTYIIGMKNQFSQFDIYNFELKDRILYITDEMGFVLYSQSENQTPQLSDLNDSPYGLALYIALEKITKQELPENVLIYYHNNLQLLMRSIDNYQEQQGKGFICWRFIVNKTNDKKNIQPSILQKN